MLLLALWGGSSAEGDCVGVCRRQATDQGAVATGDRRLHPGRL